jgi:hypothetical protein
MITTNKHILQLLIIISGLFCLTGCKSWRDNIADYSEESYDSTVNFIDKVAVDFHIKKPDKYKRIPYKDEVLIKNKYVCIAYSPRINRITTIERPECENTLYMLPPDAEKKARAAGVPPMLGGGSLLYDMTAEKTLSTELKKSDVDELCLNAPGDISVSLKVLSNAPDVILSVKKPHGSLSETITARFEFNKPLSIVFEYLTDNRKNSKILQVRPHIGYFVPPKNNNDEQAIEVYGSWVVILYRNDMIIFARAKTEKVPPRASYRFKLVDNKLIFDSIIFPSGSQKQSFSERWQVLYRTALYNPRSLTDFLMQNHINNIYKKLHTK